MPLQFGGYTCDKCNTIVVDSSYHADALDAIITSLPEKAILRIYCSICGAIKEYAEQTMKLKDVGDIKDE